MKYKIDNNCYYVSLDPGEEINNTFENIALKESIKTAWINGIGAIRDVEMGYYDIESKTYIRQIFKEDFELTSLIGNISIKDEKLYSHTHITFSDKDFNVYGGHMFKGTISAAGEFIMIKGDGKINRKFNSDIGLGLWCFDK
tara:strand:+ start:1039 stop:1464 length:426 start_codon:yes stop_codon:yes gene_type:complete